MTEELPVVRGSYLSAYADCTRRGAARLFPDLVKDAGYRLNWLNANIGAATGTGTHAAAAVTLGEKAKTGELGNITEAEQAGLDALNEAVEYGVTWDPTSPDLNTAQKQVIRQHKIYRMRVATKIQPVTVEKRLNVRIDDLGLILSGQSDVIATTTDAELRDLKTGVVSRANGPQYGAYVLLQKAHGDPVLGVVEDYVERAPISKPQPEPVENKYNAERVAFLAESVLRRIRQDLDAWTTHQNPVLAWIANPNSMLCSEKFCPAYGTDFCFEHKGAH